MYMFDTNYDSNMRHFVFATKNFVTCDMAFMSPKMSATINKKHTHDDKLHLPTAVNVGHLVIAPFLANQLQK